MLNFQFQYSTPIAGNMIDAHFGINNAFYIQRTTSSWTSASTSWVNAPATSSTNQILVSKSTSSFQDEIITITDLLNDIRLDGNNGFLMKLQTETAYNIRQYVSSYDNNIARHLN